jgi:hypothetical protein
MGRTHGLIFEGIKLKNKNSYVMQPIIFISPAQTHFDNL